MSADIALALVLAIPFQRHLVQVSALAHDRDGHRASLFQSRHDRGNHPNRAWHFLRRLRGIMLLIVPLLALTATTVIQDPSGIIDGIVNSEILALDEHQK